MNGWYFIYLLMTGINGVMLGCNGYMIWNWQWWVWMSIPIVTYIAGREMERGSKHD